MLTRLATTLVMACHSYTHAITAGSSNYNWHHFDEVKLHIYSVANVQFSTTQITLHEVRNTDGAWLWNKQLLYDAREGGAFIICMHISHIIPHPQDANTTSSVSFYKKYCVCARFCIATSCQQDTYWRKKQQNINLLKTIVTQISRFRCYKKCLCWCGGVYI